jgi:hypothetical protein
MQLLSKMISVLFFLTSFSSFAQTAEQFRTPAKLYAGAYTVKIQLKKGYTEYDVPFFIKPDQAESTLDPTLIRELGFSEKTFHFDSVRIAGKKIDHHQFKPMKSEWAFVPDFAKSCCAGVLGRDVLSRFEIRFDPGSPIHIVWKRLPSKSENEVFKPAFLAELKKLFSLASTNDRVCVLNLQDRILKFEGAPVKSGPALFTFYIIPPDRELRVMEITKVARPSAIKAGFASGLTVTEINGASVGKMDRWLVEKYLKGEKGSTLRLTTAKGKQFVFDFAKNSFE